MLRTRGKFILDHRTVTRSDGKSESLAVMEGLIIYAMYKDIGRVDIAEILWAPDYENCYIKTIGEAFQDNVVIYDDFKDFIYLIDEAYFMINVLKNKYPKKPVSRDEK